MNNIFVVFLTVLLSACAGTAVYEQYSDRELGENGIAVLHIYAMALKINISNTTQTNFEYGQLEVKCLIILIDNMHDH